MEEICQAYEPTLPLQPFVEVRSKSSQKSVGSVMRSREKSRMEDTLESKEEEVEPLIKKGKKPNEFLVDQETTRENVSRK